MMQKIDQMSIQVLLEQLKQAANNTDLKRGQKLDSYAAQAGHLTNKYVATALIIMYSKCGSMSLAQNIFQGIHHPDVVMWNNLILGYLKNRETIKALDCLLNFFTIPHCQPDSVTFVAAFKAYGYLAAEQQLDKNFCLEKGMEVHKLAQKLGFHDDKVVATNLVEMYSKCGYTTLSRAVFNNMTKRNVVHWTSLILGHVDNGKSHIAVELFMSGDSEPDAVLYVAGLKACTGLAVDNRINKRFCLEKGLAFHVQYCDRGFFRKTIVGNALIDMYRKCGSMVNAYKVFSSMPFRDRSTWNTLLLGYVEEGESLKALEMFTKMTCERDSVTFVAGLKACTSLSRVDKVLSLEKGLVIHRIATQQNFNSNCMVANSLVDMYSKCGTMLQAQEAFNGVPCPNCVLWTSLILGYVENKEHLKALDVFTRMDCEPDSLAIIAGLRAWLGLNLEKQLDDCFILEKVIECHIRAIQHGLDSDVFLSNTLIKVYSSLNSTRLAQAVFHRILKRNIVSWNNMITGHVDSSESAMALEIFRSIDCNPDSFTYVYALKACSGLMVDKGLSKQFCLEKGMCIHRELKHLEFDQQVLVSNALIEMYGRCGSISLAREVFDSMLHRDVVTYNILMLSYVENEMSGEAIEIFTHMDCEPTPATFVAALKASGAVAGLAVGERIHAHVRKLGLEQNIMVATSLVDFYGKCGMMDAAEQVFSQMHSRDIVSWNALMAGYSVLGETDKVFGLVKKIQDLGLKMNETTFLLILTACSHAGKVKEGKKHFESMPGYGITPTSEHYACLIDMLGRANRLHEALAVLKNMPFEPTRVMWRTLLGACKKWDYSGNIARETFKNSLTVE